jgi:hypothetical protein
MNKPRLFIVEDFALSPTVGSLALEPDYAAAHDYPDD